MISMPMMMALVIINSLMFSTSTLKMALMLLIFSASMFTTIYFMTGLTLISILGFTLFAGGILIMLMVLSSLSPNIPSKKTKSFNMLVLTLAMVQLWYLTPCPEYSQEVLMTKSPFTEGKVVMNMCILILAYFSAFILILNSKNMTMRFYL